MKILDETIGITFAAHNENRDGTLKTRISINSFSEYVQALGLTMSRAAYTSQVTDKYLKRSIVVHITEDISSMQFSLNKEQKKFIYECGVNAVKEQILAILVQNGMPTIINSGTTEENDDKFKCTTIDHIIPSHLTNKIVGYERINNFKDVAINSYIKYFIVDSGVALYRKGGLLVDKSNLPYYVVLSNGKNKWSVNAKNTVFYKRISDNDELAIIHDIYKKKLEEKDAIIDNLNATIKTLTKTSGDYVQKMLDEK